MCDSGGANLSSLAPEQIVRTASYGPSCRPTTARALSVLVGRAPGAALWARSTRRALALALDDHLVSSVPVTQASGSERRGWRASLRDPPAEPERAAARGPGPPRAQPGMGRAPARRGHRVSS